MCLRTLRPRFCYFDEADVVRHHLVQRIVRAYDEHKGRSAEQQMTLLAEPIEKPSGRRCMRGSFRGGTRRAQRQSRVRCLEREGFGSPSCFFLASSRADFDSKVHRM